MKIAVISDIHSNLEALVACIDRATELGVQRFICLGDVVGYGADAAPVLDRLLSLPGFNMVIGNHDESMFMTIDTDMSPPINHAAEINRKQLDKKHLDYLKSLSYVHVENGVTYAHASASCPNDWAYLLTKDLVLPCMDAARTNLTFIGHVHIPKVFHETTSGKIEIIDPEQDAPMALNQNRRYVINVGSVGQPRDNNNQASFVIYNEELHNITFHRVAYDYPTTMMKIKKAGLNDFFAERLEQGI